MDILNFISWTKNGRTVTTVDGANTLVPLGFKDPKRDDGYLAGAVSVADLLSGAVPDFNLGSEGFKAGTNAGGLLTSSSTYITAIGYNALGSAQAGQNESIAIGSYALGSVVLGGSGTNIAIGVQSMGNTTTSANGNIAIGRYTMQDSQYPGSENLAIGHNSMQLSAGSGQNVCLGHTNLQSLTNGHSNTAIGYSNSLMLTTGIENTAIGRNSLFNTTTGSLNTVIGFKANYSGNYTGCIVIGHEAQASGNNQFVVGSTTTNAGTVTNEVNTSTKVWNVRINGVARKILLA